MTKRILVLLILALLQLEISMSGETNPPIAVFWENNFPAADSTVPEHATLAAAFPGAAFVTAQHLPEALARPETRLLVLPFGSAFPAEAWPSIESYLERGGNLLVLGGKPFTRPVYREGEAWKLHDAQSAFAQQLFINAYQTTPGTQELSFHPNSDFGFLHLPHFTWSQSFSLIIRMSDETLYPREGSAGTIDARLQTLVSGIRDGRRLSAPLVEIDHVRNRFAGGRWVFLACTPAPDFYKSASAEKLIATLAQQALQGAEEFTVRPTFPLFLPGEPVNFEVRWQRFVAAPPAARLEISIQPESGPGITKSVELAPKAYPFVASVNGSPIEGKGFYEVTGTLFVDGKVAAIDHNGFWMRDEQFLRSGPRVTVNHDLFEFDGHPRLVVGTTYMAGDVQRQFFLRPNPYVWNRDMAAIKAAGINMLRTGWWSGWDQVMKSDGVVSESALRAVEAFLMTARKYELPVQFTFFAFLPDVLGGSNAYLDPESLRRQKDLITAVVSRFKNVPFLMWDLINEPSFDNPKELWETRPNRDWAEAKAWNKWLKSQYADRKSLAEAWRATPIPDSSPVPLPADSEFSSRAPYQTNLGSNALKIYDFDRFSQEEFLHWVEEMRSAIRSAGSAQLITVGQDEGGGTERPSPDFFGKAVDFTTNHTWWLSDALLWDSLVAKQPDQPLLIQETGVARSLQVDGSARRSPDEEAELLERKMAMALGTSAGAVEWLWNVNAYMRDDNEVAIGAVRGDGTEKPEAQTMRRFAAFAAAVGGALSQLEPPEVAVVTSQALQFSAWNNLAVEARQKSVRALHYYCHVPAFVVGENRVAEMGHPKLAILPSPHALSDDAWQKLVDYVRGGGNLLITGSMERDPHWQITHRLSAFRLEAQPRPLTARQVDLQIGGDIIPLSFDGQKQEAVEMLSAVDGKSFHEFSVGKGKIFVTAYPVELAEGVEPAAEVYKRVLSRLEIESPFEGTMPSPGILIRPEVFADSILYLFVSERDRPEHISITDNEADADIQFTLPPQRARLMLLRKSDGKVLAQYGF